MSATAARPLSWPDLVRIPPAWLYTIRVVLAFTLALYAAYFLELDSPASAGVTVIVVMNASRGALLSKSVWRITGTVVGASAAVVLIAWFAQAPVLFMVGLAVWLGLCTFISSVLRYNRSYGAVLAGYTVTLVAFGAVANPDRIFQLATARVAVVTLGVLSTAFVFLITDPGPSPQALERRVGRLIASAARILHGALATGDLDSAAVARRSLAAELLAIDQVVEFAGAEDASLGRFKADLRLAFAEIFAALTGGLHTLRLLRQTPHHAALAAALDHVAALDLPTAALRRVVQDAVSHVQDEAARCADVPVLAALDQSTALLQRFDAALASLQALEDGKPRAVPIRLLPYVNVVSAGRNAMRAALAILIGGLFWIYTQWPEGGAMMTLLGPVTALCGQAESASAASLQFLKGTTLAVILGGIISTAVLPQITGFPLLMAAILPCLIVGVRMSYEPRFGLVPLAFLVFFVTAVGPTNPMHYNLAASLNIYVAFVAGAFCAVLAFAVLLPPNPVAEARVLTRSLRHSLPRLARKRRLPPLLVWEHLQHQKLVRLSRRLAALPVQQAAAMRGGTAVIVASRHLGALRRAARDTTLPAAARTEAGRAADAMRHILTAPRGVLESIRQAEVAVGAALHLAAVLHDLAAVIDTYADFFAEQP